VRKGFLSGREERWKRPISSITEKKKRMENTKNGKSSYFTSKAAKTARAAYLLERP